MTAPRRLPELLQGILGSILGTALADGRIQPEERAVLRAIMEDFELEEGDLITSFEEGKLPNPTSAGPLSDLEKLAVMRYAVLAAQADGSIARSEQGFLKKLGERLRLTPAEWDELEQFSQDLYQATRGGKVDPSNLKRILDRYMR